MFQPITVRIAGVSDEACVFNNSFPEQQRIWANSAFSIRLFLDHYVHYPVSLSKSANETMKIGMKQDGGNQSCSPLILVGRYERVIRMSVPWLHNYAHTIRDALTPLFGFPKAIIETSHFVCPNIPIPSMVLGLEWFGLDKRIIRLKCAEYIWAHECYTYDTGVVDHQPPVVFKAMRDWVIKRLKLDKEKPWRYVFMSRDPPDRRRIANIGELYGWATKEYRKVPVVWEIVRSPVGLESGAVMFNSLRLLFAAHGAGLVNLLFMQPRSVVCEFQGSRCHRGFTGMSRMFGLLHVAGRSVKMSHFATGEMAVPIPVARQMISAGIRFLQSH
jgi:hypothetical protein